MTPIALERPMKPHGTFLLPDLSPEVPTFIGTQALAFEVLAKFCLAADKVGMGLPTQDPNKLEVFAQQQLQSWIASQIGKNARATLVGQPSLALDDDKLEFRMNAESRLPLMQMKSVIEALENHAPGLGRYVVDVIESCHRSGVPLYSPLAMGWHTEYTFHGQTTDLDFLAETGDHENLDDLSPKEITALIEKESENYGFMPSDVLKSVDGHAWLLGWFSDKGPQRLKALRTKRVREILRSREISPSLRNCVKNTIEVERLFKRNRNKFHWHSENQVGDTNEDEQLGAACFLLWKDKKYAYELASGFEQNLYEAGMAAECLCRFSVAFTANDLEILKFVRLIRDYIEQWNALGELLAQFPRLKSN